MLAGQGPLMPGETGKITVKTDAPNSEGPFVKTVRVHTNDPKRPKVTLTVKAVVRKKTS